jgi:hypothetical protein
MVMLQPGEGAGEVREHVAAGATAKWARHGHVATGGRTVRQPPTLQETRASKTPTLLAKAFPTGFPSYCWERTVGVLSDEKELFANRNAGPVGKASPTAMCTVGEGGTPSAQLPLPSPTGKRRLLAKTGWQRSPALPTVCFANSMGRSCWQSRRASGGSPALPTALAHAVGKAENFFPFLLLFSSL